MSLRLRSGITLINDAIFTNLADTASDYNYLLHPWVTLHKSQIKLGHKKTTAQFVPGGGNGSRDGV